MKTIKTDVLIIGGGLTGLTLAYLLKSINIKVKVLEANSTIGGRINTKHNTNQAPIELGATWLIDQQFNALALLKELGISVFKQHYGNTAIYHPNKTQAVQLVELPENNLVSYRVTNGTYSIIKSLSERLSENTITCNQKILTIKLLADDLEASSNDTTYYCKHIVSTLPPLLFSKKIAIEPALPQDFQELLLKTHTWMHNSIRIGFTYKTPFWKSKDTSGTIYSSVGVIQEFYDHSNANSNLYALSGFMSSAFSKNKKEERKKLALKQLQSYYGDQALTFESYEECVWANEKYTTSTSDRFIIPQSNNGHPLFQNTYLDNKLFIAGAETSPVFPGKMEGAITSAQFVFEKLKAIYHN
ncbi:flavin monoamine oxidase family protein [Lacinutrix jangbogonensis]|uniref:flavin monoamine oxidase family protein n=1 Tax=Lacinutrix jangbogonensis TaxID=1469557 RepID=UPI00053E36AF|nr:FAD-dependent oxidoreductase [Lacinutrix jangbogonensis]